MTNYKQEIQGLADISFNKIRNVANSSISHLSSAEKDILWQELEKGIALLDTHEHLCQYLYSYGQMHQAKLLDAFSKLPLEVFQDSFEIIDWGCGQALGTINLFDFLNTNGLLHNVKKVTLIEPSKPALERGLLHVSAYPTHDINIASINAFFEQIDPQRIKSNNGYPVIHIFSNIIDVPHIDLKYLSKILNDVVSSTNHIVCVGPLNPNNPRLDAFFRYFNVPLLFNIEQFGFKGRNWTYKCLIYKLDPEQIDRLIQIVYYPAVYFKSAYQLDIIKGISSEVIKSYYEKYSVFEVNAPFDLGASVYTDVHPVFAVLNNIISRGIPTRTSPYIEEIFSRSFNRSKKEISLGEIIYAPKIDHDRTLTIEVLVSSDKLRLSSLDEVTVQELLTPIAVARFQKLLVEAVLTDKLKLDAKKWKILVHERDVPFSNIAIKDFVQLYSNLVELSSEYHSDRLPEIDLDILSNDIFYDSPLHGNCKVYRKKEANMTHTEYDMVVDFSMLEYNEIKEDEFSEYLCRNQCYFKVQKTPNGKAVSRSIYTSSLIKYKDLELDSEEVKNANLPSPVLNLEYFLQLLFRKEKFRPGQLPILNRALQNKSVIGLLPTGGGKSLTYQLAALLQPGVTMVIDPLISLMIDQYEGLLSNGIDCCTYINSTVDHKERKKREMMLQSSQLLFVFVSPERLSILEFRRRLSHMHDYNVYFSYAVIDEVHCVSEWGHDFRFSYLHLGRNLYNYVKSKEGNISIFGLTATASFDVLADVERELSGSNAFDLDPDTIVRYENTNRLELQYKIERVKVKFDRDQYFDQNNHIDPSLPRPLNINKHWSSFDSKKSFIKNYIHKVPDFINEIQSPQNEAEIKRRFNERQNTEIEFTEELYVDIDNTYTDKKEYYNQAGILFCPHRDNTGISVNVVKSELQTSIRDVESFVGGDINMEPLERFRGNNTPLMIATKAFGMGIDKPNVRHTINMNYSSSLEGFVQEAGRAGRDQKMALSVILFADYELARIRKNIPDATFPLGLIKNKWYYKKDLHRIIEFYGLNIDNQYIEIATPKNDIANLWCKKDNRMFAMNQCNNNCSSFRHCQLKKAPPNLRFGWHTEEYLKNELKEVELFSLKSHFRYMSPDYGTNMHFYNQNFKGDIIEKTFMYNLLSVFELQFQKLEIDKENGEPFLTKPVNTKGFLNALLAQDMGEDIMVMVPYIEEDKDQDIEGNKADIAKAIYRLCCIELIEDFTQNYKEKHFRIKVRRKAPGEYFSGLCRFLERYYTPSRAKLEMNKAENYSVKIAENQDTTVTEIHRCLGYLTEFIYDKISEKRKRAINDIRDFCLVGLDESESKSWIERNENLKDFIYYYFNSKYAKTDYVTESGLEYSLTNDTDRGKISNLDILLKYLKVTDEDIVGISTPIDNIKHLQGAVRLISRSLTDSNPVLALLNAYTIFYIGVRNNENLLHKASRDYVEGMIELAERNHFEDEFWQAYQDYNDRLGLVVAESLMAELKDELKLTLFNERLKLITESYLK